MILRAEVNVGYEEQVGQLASLNGEEVLSLRGLKEQVEAITTGSYSFKLDSGEVIVMDAAKRNLMVVLLQERVSIKDTQEIISSLVRCVGHLHANGKIHADIKPLNAVRMNDKTWRLIDFDGAVVSFVSLSTPP